MYAYQEQGSQQTLAQALQEYHAVHPGLSQARHMSPKAAFFFRCHDMAHVVSGCGVDLDDEGAVKIASLLGTTAGLGVLKDMSFMSRSTSTGSCAWWKCCAPWGMRLWSYPVRYPVCMPARSLALVRS